MLTMTMVREESMVVETSEQGKVPGHQGHVRDGQDALHLVLGGLAEGLVDLLSQGLLLNLDDQVHHGHVGGGHTQGNTCNNRAHWR